MVNLPSDGEVELRLIWQELRGGRLQLLAGSSTDEVHKLGLAQRAVPGEQSISSAELDILERALAGGGFQGIAIDLGISISAIVLATSRCLQWMGSDLKVTRSSPLLAFAACASVSSSEAKARITTCPEGLELTMPRPELSLTGIAGPAQRAVLKLYVEGHGHVEIAKKRNVAVRATGIQLTSVFRSLNVRGRSELLALLFKRTFEAAA